MLLRQGKIPLPLLNGERGYCSTHQHSSSCSWRICRLFSRRKDFRFLADMDELKCHAVFITLKWWHSLLLCQHEIWLYHEEWGWGCLFPSSKCIDYICIHTKSLCIFLSSPFQDSPQSSPKAKSPLGTKFLGRVEAAVSVKSQAI